jgi:tRNA dimethylallyltransferase
MSQHILIITGPTGSGKSKLAMLLAQEIPAVIINADSMQVYREIPIITAQPTAEEKKQAPHALYGALPAAERCTVARWLELAAEAIRATWAEGKTPLLTGGTGLYLTHLMKGISPVPQTSDATRKKVRALLEEMGRERFFKALSDRDPVIARRLDRGNTQRILRAYEVYEQTGIPLSTWQEKPPQPYFPGATFKGVAFCPPREHIYGTVNRRFERMVTEGALEEARALMEQHLDPSLPAMKAHGVPELMAYLKGTMPLPQAVAQAQINTRHYIKRQITWLKHQMPSLPFAETPEAALEALA